MEFLVMFGSTLWQIYPQECEFFLPFSVISESFGGWIFLSAGLVPEFDLWFEGPNLVWWFLLLKPTSPPWSFRGIQWKCWQDGNKCPVGGVSCATIYKSVSWAVPKVWCFPSFGSSTCPLPCRCSAGAAGRCQKLNCIKANSATKSSRTLGCFESDFRITH